ncbi:hypothetical protein JOD64_003482 [Micromonospora luteifusca]|uniref:Uncharacterized protein n=1 Tax=Micromonospora luteifusca TaxID=709860 RepID=A0ABS2LVP8_9ACTN|nr:hypothetical protein [Micromonospora luteifusca]
MAALPGGAGVVGAGGCGQRVDGGAQQAGGFGVEGAGESESAVGLLGQREVAVAGGAGGFGLQCGPGGGVGDVGCDVVEDAGAEFAQQGGVELPSPVDEHSDGFVGGFGAGGGVHGGDGVGDDSGLVEGDGGVGQCSSYAWVGGVECGGEVDESAGGGDGEVEPFAQPDRGG